MADEETKVYALNLFDIADREEYLAYSRRSAREVARHGGHVLALGRFNESVTGDIAPRQVLLAPGPAKLPGRHERLRQQAGHADGNSRCSLPSASR